MRTPGAVGADRTTDDAPVSRGSLTKVPLRRVHKSDPLDDPFATFTEWDSEADHRAFEDL